MVRRELIVACGLIGALGGALFGFAVQRPNAHRGSWDLILALTACTAVSATLLGAAIARRLTSDARRAGSRAVAFSFAFGALNGVLMVFAMSVFKSSHGGAALGIAFFAALFGGVCALPFIPAIVAVSVTAARVSARPGSVAEAAQRRRILRVAALSLAIASLLFPPNDSGSLWLHLPLHVTNLAFALIVAMLFADLAASHRLRRLTLGPEWQLAEVPPDTEPRVDFGLGSDVYLRVSNDATYRSDVGKRDVVLGDRARAIDTVRTSLLGHSIAAIVAVASIVVQLDLIGAFTSACP